MNEMTANTVTFIAALGIGGWLGIYCGYECYYGRMGRRAPAFIVGIAVALGAAYLIAQVLKYATGVGG
jgi:hypothetical protein